jgi:hypothetical protein
MSTRHVGFTVGIEHGRIVLNDDEYASPVDPGDAAKLCRELLRAMASMEAEEAAAWLERWKDAHSKGYDPDTTCGDCGSTPSHEDAPCGYCRRCAEKAGYRHSFFTSLDHDKLRGLLGRELADEVLRECEVP